MKRTQREHKAEELEVEVVDMVGVEEDLNQEAEDAGIMIDLSRLLADADREAVAEEVRRMDKTLGKRRLELMTSMPRLVNEG